jgi:rubredoxin
MDHSHSARTPVKVCPHCTTLDIAHVGDTEKSRWLECRECGHVWNYSLPTPPATVREQTPWGAEPRRWTLRDEAERRIEDHRARPRDAAAWTKDPGWPRDRWPTERGREESKK